MLRIYTLVVTPFAQNARVVCDLDSAAVCIVDPGGDVSSILKIVEELSPTSLSVLLTHAHIDHGGGVANCIEQASSFYSEKIPLLAYTDGALRSSIAQQAAVFGLPASEYRDVPEPTTLLNEGDTVSIGSYQGKVFWTPGHAPDHISIYFEETQCELHSETTEQVCAPLLLVGDALFDGSIGRTDLPGGSHPTLISSIKEKLFPLPESTIVLSGHGPNTTIGKEKDSNPFLQ